MKRILATAAVATLGLIGITAGGASANASGYCTLPGGRVNMAVIERVENVIQDVTFNSTPQLSMSGSSWTAYGEAGQVLDSGHLASYPIKGDGFWNYLWDRHPSFLYASERVRVVPMDTAGHTCVTNLYF